MLLEDLHICSGRMTQTMRLCVCCRVLPSSEEYNRVQNQTFWTNKHPESHHLLLWSGAVYQWDEISEMTFVKLSSLPFIILLSTELTSILRCLCTVMLTADREDDLNLDTETLSVCHLWLSKLPFWDELTQMIPHDHDTAVVVELPTLLLILNEILQHSPLRSTSEPRDVTR